MVSNGKKSEALKYESVDEFHHVIFCKNPVCTQDQALNQRIATIQKWKQVKLKLQQILGKKKRKRFSMNQILFIFDIWYNISKFTVFKQFIVNSRVCKYWNQHTSRTLTQLRIRLIGEQFAENSAYSIHSWFSHLLHKHNEGLFSLSNKIELEISSHHFPCTLPFNLDSWILECKMFSGLVKEISKWNLEWLRIYFYLYPKEIGQTDNQGRNLMHWASQHGYFDLVKMLLFDYKLDPEINGDHDISTIVFAIQSGDESLCKLLLEYKISVNKESAGIYPIHYAAVNANLEILRLLLENKANPFLLSRANHNAFDYAWSPSPHGYKFLMEKFSTLSREWNIFYTIEIRNQSGKEKLCFVLDSEHFYTIPIHLANLT